MQRIVLLATLVAAALAIPYETYNPKYDNFNSQELLKNERLLLNFGKCMTGEGPCTAEGSDLKQTMPEALKTNCAKCTPKQRQHIRIMYRAFQKKFPDILTKLSKQQDPKGEYKKSFDDFLNADD